MMLVIFYIKVQRVVVPLARTGTTVVGTYFSTFDPKIKPFSLLTMGEYYITLKLICTVTYIFGKYILDYKVKGDIITKIENGIMR